MPYINFYADETDLKQVHHYFNQHPEIAFIVPIGRGRWRAQMVTPALKAKSIALWHVPGGPLPLPYSTPGKKDGRIRDPWKGWKELFPGADRSCPYFGPGHPALIWLTQRPRARYVKRGIGMSSFEWIGNYYSRARKSTELFWKSLRQWVKQNTTLIPRKGRVNGPNRDVWAFPSALASFQQGRGRDED